MPEHTVRAGECITSIADAQGFYWKTVWEHSRNRELRELRTDPNMLVAGDRVFVPEKSARREACATEARHRFKKKGIPAVLRLQLFDGHEARAKQSFVIVVDGRRSEGETDAEGALEVPIAPGAKRARLVIGEDEAEYDIVLGHLPPKHDTEGVRTRLRNLGYLRKRVEGALDDATRAALRAFQSDFELEETGEPDDATVEKLAATHDASNEFATAEQ